MESTSQIQSLLMDYSKIEKSDYKAKVQFYEERRSKINELLSKDKVELDVDYTFALFELGKYYKCLSILDGLIETVIRENILLLDGVDIFHALLFKKAASHYNLGEIKESTKVLEELIKMDSQNETYQTFFKRCYRNEYKQDYKWMGGLVVGLFLLAASIISLEILVVRPFYFESAWIVEIARNSIFAIAIFILLAKEYKFSKALTRKLTSLIK